jgi:glycosyltransferase involved in cell wall biosynthesis
LIRTAFVIPWFGRSLVGGAEQHVLQVASRLAKRRHHIEVLTTCCRSSYDDWQQNHLAEGVSEESGVIVRRFPVRPRNVAAFDIANREIIELNERPKAIGVCPVSEGAAWAFVEENIHSPKLLDYLECERDRYQSIVLAPYLYGPTLLGVERAGDRAVLLPMLHDETYAYLPAVESIFHKARRILFNSEGEAMLAARLYGPSMWQKGIVTGEGVETRESAGAALQEGRTSDPPIGAYLLYLGRRDRTKNTDFLLRAFQRYRASRPDALLQVVLAGPGDLPWDEAKQGGVVDLGMVSEARKAALLANCRALVQPSRNESYSRTMMEAWLHAKPVVVHSECLATSRAAEVSGGGWAASSEAEWAEIFATLETADDAALRERGQRGLTYAQEYADWDKAIRRYEEALELRPLTRAQPAPRRPAVRAIHQLLQGLDYGDAISNQAVFIKEVLRDLGYESEIFVVNIGAPMADLGKVFKPGDIGPADGLLFHHSIGSALTSQAIQHPGPKALVYHNITPSHFFEPWDPAFAGLLEAGRNDLHDMAPLFPISIGDSTYNAAELREFGFHEPGVMPIFVDPLRWAQPADPEWMEGLQDGRTNLLFAGRVAPNKCQHHLLEAFKEYLSFDPEARLLLVGVWPDGHPYLRFLRDEAERRGIRPQVVLTGRITDAQLLACYRTAHLFWSMSEHEGFCVPLIEAMWFDVPVLAYRSSAIPETLGPAGLMFTEKNRWTELAALAHLLVEDRALRQTVIAAQRTRRPAFLPKAILPVLLELVSKLGGAEYVRVGRTEPVRDSPRQQPKFESSSEYASMIWGHR